MSWWQRLKAVFRSEASDVREGLRNVGRTLDEELARKEQELAATPAERIDMILEEQQDQDARFDELSRRVTGAPAPADPDAKSDEPPDEPDASDTDM